MYFNTNSVIEYRIRVTYLFKIKSTKQKASTGKTKLKFHFPGHGWAVF